MDQKKEAWHQVIMCYGVHMLPELRRMTFPGRAQMLSEVTEVMLSDPVHMCHEKQFLIPSWRSEKLTGGQVQALAVYGLWVHCGEDEDMAAGLLGDWPEIKTACTLAPSTSENTEQDAAEKKAFGLRLREHHGQRTGNIHTNRITRTTP